MLGTDSGWGRESQHPSGRAGPLGAPHLLQNKSQNPYSGLQGWHKCLVACWLHLLPLTAFHSSSTGLLAVPLTTKHTLTSGPCWNVLPLECSRHPQHSLPPSLQISAHLSPFQEGLSPPPCRNSNPLTPRIPYSLPTLFSSMPLVTFCCVKY